MNWFFALIFLIIVLLSINLSISFFSFFENMKSLIIVGIVFILLAILFKELV